MTKAITIPLTADYILIVDDNVDFADTLKLIFAERGSVDVAYNGDEGLKKIMTQDYDLIVSDIDMPVMDGLAFYSRATAEFPGTKGKFIFVTGDANLERLAFFQKHGISHLLKPASIKDMRIAAEKILILKAKK